MNMKRSSRLIGLLSGIGLLVFPVFSYATELSVEPDRNHAGPGFTIRLILQYDRPINAIEGILTYDEETVRVARIIESPAGVPLWVERPFNDDAGHLSFTGIFPGGIEPRLTDRLSVLDISFEALKEGEVVLGLENVRVLLNAPVPTEDDVRVLPLTVRIGSEDIGAVAEPDDTVPPQVFDVNVVSDSGLYGGKAVAVYHARDLESGIDYYEIRQRFLGVFGLWQPAEGITELSGLWRFSIMEVRATDRAGNSAIARHIPLTLYGIYVLFGMLVVLGVRRSRKS